MDHPVALVASDDATRVRLRGYLEAAGFAIDVFAETPPIAGTSTQAVWVVDKGEEAMASKDLIRPWLIARAIRRVVILTWRPRSVRDALKQDEDRLEIMVPPVFPWQIVDALRGPGGARAWK